MRNCLLLDEVESREFLSLPLSQGKLVICSATDAQMDRHVRRGNDFLIAACFSKLKRDRYCSFSFQLLQELCVNAFFSKMLFIKNLFLIGSIN